MCIICVEWQKGRLTLREVVANTTEMVPVIGEDHAEEVLEMVLSAEKGEDGDE